VPYDLVIRGEFSAAHNLRAYRGKCERLHGHTWRVDLYLTGTDLGAEGMVLDFAEAKRILEAVLADLDHAYLNEVPPFDRINPSSENLARVLAERVAERLPEGVRLTALTVWESDRCGATYRPQGEGGRPAP